MQSCVPSSFSDQVCLQRTAQDSVRQRLLSCPGLSRPPWGLQIEAGPSAKSLPVLVGPGLLSLSPHLGLYVCIPFLLSLPPLPHPHPPRSSQGTRLGSPCYAATSHQLSVLHKGVYICQCYFLHSSHSFIPPLCPQVPSLYLYSFPTNRFINAIFLNSIYMH